MKRDIRISRVTELQLANNLAGHDIGLRCARSEGQLHTVLSLELKQYLPHSIIGISASDSQCELQVMAFTSRPCCYIHWSAAARLSPAAYEVAVLS